MSEELKVTVTGTNIPDRVERCTTHHYACDCREWAHEQVEKSLQSRLAKARDAMRNAMNEIGVPQPGYPAPVGNAYDILSRCLDEIGGEG